MRDPLPAARARLPLECEPDPSKVRLMLSASIDAASAIDRLAGGLAMPREVIAAAAWVAFAWRVGIREEAVRFELVTEAGHGSKRAMFAIAPEETSTFAEHAARVRRAEPAADAAFRIDVRGEGAAAPLDGPLPLATLEIRGSQATLALDGSRFDDGAARRIGTSFEAFVSHAADMPAARIGDLRLVGLAESRTLLEAFNDTDDPFDATCFHYLFEDQAHLTPDRPALACGGDVLTYAELNARANQIAWLLRRSGGGNGRCVGLLVERSALMIVGLLGILKAGSAYTPLLPGLPRARLLHQLEETAAAVVLTQASLERSIGLPKAVAAVCLDRDRDTLAREPAGDPPRTTDPHDLAYVIYTSGSTGQPKGVAVRHDNLVNYTRALARKIGVTPVSDGPALSFATVSTLAADLGNTSIFPCLASGGVLHVIDEATSLDGQGFAVYAAAHPIDVLKITPLHLTALAAFEHGEDILPRRVLITGGEASSWPLLDLVRKRPGLHWLNHYGPTETTIGSLTFDVEAGLETRRWAGTVPIGQPIGNTRAYVLDNSRALLPIGVPGELYIAGRGVSAGYLNQPGLTNERFIDDRFSSTPGAKMYRTGDRVRRLPNGAIEFLGRVDHQVKIRGYRIELGEIEAALRRQPAVAQAVVMAREDRPGDRRLVAYVVPREIGRLTEPVLREALAPELPAFMVPSACVLMEALPLTANGKLDRRALPPPAETAIGRACVPGPARHANQIESRIASIWKDVLGLRSIGWHDDFFSAGGDSLKALHAIARMERDLGMRVTHAMFIAHPTIEGVAAALQRRAPERQFASLVPLQPHGTKPPLFCVHGGGGHCYYYRDLARRLGPDQPFWGLQGRHVDGRLSRQTTVEAMAAFYLSEIKQIAPEGPYFLCGASFGGKVAFEMAQMLRKQGDVVALVAMFDTWGPGYPRFRVGRTLQGAGWLYRRIEHHVGSLFMLDSGQRAHYLREKAGKTRQEIADAFSLRLARVRGTRVSRVGARPDAYGDEVDEGFIAIASRGYRPSFYPGKVILFRSKQQPLGIVADHTLGWRGLAADLDIHDVIGLHAAVVAEPRVKYLLDTFRPCLERAQAEHQHRTAPRELMLA
jgi:amino acid adenylation domain-containing protein